MFLHTLGFRRYVKVEVGAPTGNFQRKARIFCVTKRLIGPPALEAGENEVICVSRGRNSGARNPPKTLRTKAAGRKASV